MQDDQGAALKSAETAARPPPSTVNISDIHFVNIRRNGLHGGQFYCGGRAGDGAAAPPCTNIVFEDVRLNVSRSGCFMVGGDRRELGRQYSSHVPCTTEAKPAAQRTTSHTGAFAYNP